METLENRDRSLHLDLMKCVALFLMPFLNAAYHLEFEGFFAPEYPMGVLSALLGLLYHFVPGVFLFCLGCGAVLTRHGQPRELKRRGGRLLLLGLALNVLRFTPFYLVKGLVLSDMAGFSRAWLWIAGSDVLPFAGMSFLFFALARKCSLPDWAVLAFGLLCSAGQMLLPVPGMAGMPGHLLGNLIFVEGGASYFPFLSWIVYPCLGYFYQSRLKTCRRPARLHLILGMSCSALLAASVAALKRRGKWQRRYLLWGEMEFRMDLPTTWITTLIGGIWLSVSYFLSGLVKRNPLRSRISAISGRMTVFYCVHWLVLMYGLLLAKLRRSRKQIHRFGGFFAVGGALVAFSAFLVKLWLLFRTHRKNR